MIIMNKKSISLILFWSLLSTPLVVASQTKNKIATEQFSSSYIKFAGSSQPLGSSTLTISGPNGYSTSRSVDSGLPSLDLSEISVPADGLYKYQLSAAIIGKYKIKLASSLNNGRKKKQQEYKSVKQHGHFYIENGVIKQFKSSPK